MKTFRLFAAWFLTVIGALAVVFAAYVIMWPLAVLVLGVYAVLAGLFMVNLDQPRSSKDRRVR